MKRPGFDPATAQRAEYAEEALELARTWADGRRSWTNIVEGEDPDDRAKTIAVLDAAETVKWSALGQALAVAEGAARQQALAEAIAEQTGLFG